MSMELGPEDVSLLGRYPDFRGCYAYIPITMYVPCLPSNCAYLNRQHGFCLKTKKHFRPIITNYVHMTTHRVGKSRIKIHYIIILSHNKQWCLHTNSEMKYTLYMHSYRSMQVY